ncbi:MAG: hypothetical protein L0I76_23240 [Pseudonocardia sp.]|nr:hypothetical protein [Pseudonocardia sp.]
MAEDQGDTLAEAAEAMRLNNLAIRQREQGRREEARTAAEGAENLYRALAERYPVMFGPDAEQADALAAAIRSDRPRASTARSTAPRPCDPDDETTTAGISTAGTARALDEPRAVATPGPEPPAPNARHGRPRWRTVITAAVVAVLLGAIGAAGWALSRPHTPAPVPISVPVQQPPPAAVPAGPWTATARTDVAPTGVTLRSAPSITAGAAVGRLPTGDEVQIQCGEIGYLTSNDADERSSSWLRTTAGSYLAAINVEVRGPSPVTNCTPGQPPVPLPHHR